MSTVKANTYQDASGGSNAQLYGVASPPNSMGFRNRIINGDCRINQRATSVTSANWTVDRFYYNTGTASKGTAAISTNAPTGFTNSLGFTSSSAYSVAAGDYFGFQQPIEGLNISDLAWGTASAATVTLSFWVRSSLTGTFGGSLRNSGAARSYVFSYTISAADTWEYKSVTIPGDTSGTWLTTNGVGIFVHMTFAAGSNNLGTAGSWSGSNLVGPTGQTSVVGTNGATFYITGVQLEAGTVASPFERRDYGRELMMCQRYYAKLQNDGSGDAVSVGVGGQRDTTSCWFYVKHPVTMRSEPTVSISSLVNTDFAVYAADATLTNTFAGYDASTVYCSMSANGAAYRAAGLQIKNNTAGFLALSSEL